MSIGQIHTLPIVQMGHVEKIVEDIQNQPQVQQLLAQEIAAKALEKANTQVQEVEASIDATKIDPDQKKDRKQKQRQKKKQYASSTDDKQDEAKGNNSRNPWAGIIVNKKV